MIIILIPIILIIIGLLIHILKKLDSTEKKICLSIVFFNQFVIWFFRLMWPGETSYAALTLLFWINLLINIIFLILLLNPKIKITGKVAIISIIFYFICMILMPVYKIEDHEHIYINKNQNDITISNKENDNTEISNEENTTINTILKELETDEMLIPSYEEIKEYIDYYNYYGIKLKRIYKNY